MLFQVSGVSPVGERASLPGASFASASGPMPLHISMSVGAAPTGGNNTLTANGSEAPKSWKSLDLDQSESGNLSASTATPSSFVPLPLPLPPAPPHGSGSVSGSNRPIFRSQRSSSMPTSRSPKNMDNQGGLADSGRNSRISVSGENNILLDGELLSDYATQALTLSILATIVRHTTDENEARILYQYLAEASVVFPKVFPVM